MTTKIDEKPKLEPTEKQILVQYMQNLNRILRLLHDNFASYLPSNFTKLLAEMEKQLGKFSR